MANNRLFLCAINQDGQMVDMIQVGKHSDGPWYLMDYLYENPREFTGKVNGFLKKAFIDGCGIALKDEYMDKPLPALWHYNDTHGHWEFMEDKEDC